MQRSSAHSASYFVLRTGFTLIELLVVISIIGILATLLLANLNAARERARDAQRKADLRTIQTALRLYYNDYSSYPTSNSSYLIVGCGASGARTACPWGAAWITSEGQTYAKPLPKDPLDVPSDTVNDYRYIYGDSETYTLEACLENRSDSKGIQTSDTTWCPSSWAYIITP